MRPVHTFARTGLLVLILLVACGGAALASRLEVRDLAYEAMDVYREDGFHLRDEMLVGKLYKGEAYYFDTQLSAGNDYFFYVAGDKRLKSVEVRVYDEKWQLVSANITNEPQAEATYKPEWSGIFHIKVNIADADKEGAYWFVISGYK